MIQLTLMTHRLVTAISQTILRKKKPSSITVTTLVLRLTLRTTEVTSPSRMPTCHTESYWWMNILHLRICRISSTANSSMKRQACTIMVQYTGWHIIIIFLHTKILNKNFKKIWSGPWLDSCWLGRRWDWNIGKNR